MVARLEIDAHEIVALARKFAGAHAEVPAAIQRAMSRTGQTAKTRVVRALTKQTGLKRAVIVRAVKAKAGRMQYELRSRGGNVHLKYFKARETRKGVSAAPWNKRRVYAGMFIKGGRFPHRKGLSLGGQVYRRTGKSRTPIVSQRSGLWIPKEMVSGSTASAFTMTVNSELPKRLAHELARIFKGT
jgi:hypothetical protein